MTDERQTTSQQQYRPNALQEQFRVQGQPFPGAQFIPSLSALPFSSQQQQRPQGTQPPGQLPTQLPARPTTTQLFPTMNPQWTLTPQMQQALRQQQNLISAQGKIPSFSNPVSAGHQTGSRPAMAAAKPPEAPSRKYKAQKKKALETAAAAAPPKIAPLPKERMPRSEQLIRLQDLDDKILKVAAQQKVAAHSSLRSGEHVKKKLRVYIQGESTLPEDSSPDRQGEPAFWSLSIWGKLMDSLDSLPAFQLQPPLSQRQASKAFSHYVRRLSLTICSQSGASNKPETIAWSKGSHRGEAREKFQIRRLGQDAVTVKVQLELDSQPQQYTLTEKLAQFMQCKLSTRTAVLQAISAYSKMHNLQETSGQTKCDALLQRTIGRESFTQKELSGLLDEHLKHLEPYAFEYTIRPGNPTKGEIDCYDLDLQVPLAPPEQQSIPALEKIPADPMAEHLQQKVNGLVTAANERARRRELLLGFSNNPTDFINSLLASQARDLRAQKQGNQPTALRRTQFFDGRWVDDAVLRYLHRKLAAGA